MVPDPRQRLLEILLREAVIEGDFTLSSGRRSDWYLDCRRATLHPEGAVLTARLVLDWLDREGLEPDCVGGPTMAADPIVGAVVTLSGVEGRGLPGFLVRKEAKGHGTGRLIEGHAVEGWRALMVEDTVTTGGSLLRAIRAVEDHGLDVIAVLSLVDREEGGREALSAYRYDSLFSVRDLGR